LEFFQRVSGYQETTMIPFLLPLLTRFPLLGRLPWKAIVISLLTIIAAWRVLAWVEGERDEREAEIRAEWAADEAIEDKLAEDQKLKNAQDEAAAAARNAERERQHREEVAAALADRDRVAGLLKRARDSARASAAAQSADQPGSAAAGTDASPGQADAEAQLDGLIADVIAEHRANASQLNALIGEIVPQL
jgi:hypothetical protein